MTKTHLLRALLFLSFFLFCRLNHIVRFNKRVGVSLTPLEIGRNLEAKKWQSTKGDNGIRVEANQTELLPTLNDGLR